MRVVPADRRGVAFHILAGIPDEIRDKGLSPADIREPPEDLTIRLNNARARGQSRRIDRGAEETGGGMGARPPGRALSMGRPMKGA
jgi:hypothetical protein